MPDLTTETRTICAQNTRYRLTVDGSKGDKHEVTFGPENPGDYQSNWHCTCQGFLYRSKCKHVEMGKARKCDAGWDAHAGGAGLGPVTSCPRCGGPVTVIKVAV